MATTIRRLKLEALESTTFRGHRMSRFSHYTPGNAVSQCLDCPAEVQVLSRPAPNQIDVGGNAVALTCPVTRND